MTNSSAWAGAARSVQYKVHIGTWVNYSRGPIMGATLTLDRTYGNLLIAFTATFVGMVTAGLWRIGCLIFHRIYSTSDARDALHHQRQAVLRNSPSPVMGLWMVSQLAWAWRHGTRRLLARTLPALIFAFLCLGAFTVAGGFSSSISSAVGNEVLLDGSNCGLPNFSDTTASGAEMKAFISRDISSSASYAQECYSNNATGTLDCTTFVKDHLPGTVDNQAACPFQGDICRSNNSNIFFDSGYINSQDFGVNAPDDQQISYRATLHCAPLKTADFARNMSTSSDNYTQYYYGPTIVPTNFTWQVEDLNGQYVRQIDNIFQSWSASLQLGVLSAIEIDTGVGDFNPDSRLSRPDADLTLIFLSGNGVYFIDSTQDPWYRGFVPGKTTHLEIHKDNNFTIYRPDEAASPMGCIQQHQFCNANRQCGNMTGFNNAVASATPFFNTSLDTFWGNETVSGPVSSRFTWFYSIMYSSYALASMLGSLGVTSLASRQYYTAGYMSQVPDNQWQLDVTHWWATLMAAMQATFVNAAHGPTDAVLLGSINRPQNSYMADMCNNQKILSTDYTSFSLFGLYFTFVTGVLIIATSYLLGPMFKFLYHRRNYQGYKFLEWAANETLQLQRMAYQGLGSESWTGYTDTIPKTRPGYFLADLPLSYAIPDDEVRPEVKKEAAVAAFAHASTTETSTGSTTEVTPAPQVHEHRTRTASSDDAGRVTSTVSSLEQLESCLRSGDPGLGDDGTPSASGHALTEPASHGRASNAPIDAEPASTGFCPEGLQSSLHPCPH